MAIDPQPFKFTAAQRQKLEAGSLAFINKNQSRDLLLRDVEHKLSSYSFQVKSLWDRKSYEAESRRLEKWAATLDDWANSVDSDPFVRRALAGHFGIEHLPTVTQATAENAHDMAQALRSHAALYKRRRGGQVARPERALVSGLLGVWVRYVETPPSSGSGSRFMRFVHQLAELRVAKISRKLVESMLAPGNASELEAIDAWLQPDAEGLSQMHRVLMHLTNKGT